MNSLHVIHIPSLPLQTIEINDLIDIVQSLGPDHSSVSHLVPVIDQALTDHRSTDRRLLLRVAGRLAQQLPPQQVSEEYNVTLLTTLAFKWGLLRGWYPPVVCVVRPQRRL